jgi:tRNA(Ile)-lysidine synthase
MVRGVRTFIYENRLLAEDGGPVIVGVSGGADSVALLAVLTRLGFRCIAAHCNFHLRGEESDRDEAFACAYARSFDVPIHTKGFDTQQYASENHLSIEMAARALRYQWFEELRLQTGAQAIAVAHHRDDQVETVLLNLIRGTGIRGLRGIRPKNGFVVRPLLAVGREEILAWLKEQGLTYVTDSSNLSDMYTRNFIRLRILPLLEEVNPSVREAIARMTGQLSAVETIYRSAIDEAKARVMDGDNRLSIAGLLRLPSPEALLYELLAPFGFTRMVSAEVFRALGKESGKRFYSPTHRLVKDREYLLISTLETPPAQAYSIPETEGESVFGTVSLSFRKAIVDDAFQLPSTKQTACFDYDKLRFPLILRTWQPGDWFIPFGMKGRKKLSDFFSDLKYSRIDKEKALLICSSDQIIWVVGQRTDERYRIDETTKNVLFINFYVKNNITN